MTVGEALFSFEGRMTRSDYWLKGVLPLLAVGILCRILDESGFGQAPAVLSAVVGAARGIVAVASLLSGFAVAVKRLHDRDHSAHFLWLLLVPIIGWLWVAVELWFLAGTAGPNRYGADPLRLSSDPMQPSLSGAGSWLRSCGGTPRGNRGPVGRCVGD